jgi:hypothetical protein
MYSSENILQQESRAGHSESMILHGGSRRTATNSDWAVTWPRSGIHHAASLDTRKNAGNPENCPPPMPENGRPSRTFGPRRARTRRDGPPYQAEGSGVTWRAFSRRCQPTFSLQHLRNCAIVSMRWLRGREVLSVTAENRQISQQAIWRDATSGPRLP